MFAVAAACSVASVLVRFRRGTQQERQQLKWLAYAMAVVLLGFGLGWVPVTTPLAEVLLLGAVTFIPVAIGIAILRYRLFDIDLLINRTLVYTLLTVVLGGTYVGVVAAARLLLQGRATAGVSLVATALVAVLFAPLRSWLQQWADRLVYGDRHDPHAALSRLGRRLEATMAPEAVLPSLVETVAESLRLPYVAVRVDTGQATAGSTVEHGRLVGEPLCLPLVHQGQPVGELVLGPRTPGEGFSAADRRVLAELATQAGVAVARHAAHRRAAAVTGPPGGRPGGGAPAAAPRPPRRAGAHPGRGRPGPGDGRQPTRRAATGGADQGAAGAATRRDPGRHRRHPPPGLRPATAGAGRPRPGAGPADPGRHPRPGQRPG